MEIKKNKSSGFTLIEIIISLSFFVVFSFLATELLINVFKTPKQQMLSSDNVDYARSITNTFVNELRNASMGNDGSYSLGKADGKEIIFYSTYQSSGGVAKRIRYFVSNNNLYKGVIIPTGSPLTYVAGSEKITTLITGLANGIMPVFYYYDGNFIGAENSPSLSNVTAIKFVKINLVVKSLTTAQGQGTFSINAGATIRNLKNNLGN